jgi:hypothetical protein
MTPNSIKEVLEKTVINYSQNENSMEEMVKKIKNNDMSNNISRMLLKTDSVFDRTSIYGSGVIPKTIVEDINILLEDSLVPMYTGESERLDMLQVVKSIAKKA